MNEMNVFTLVAPLIVLQLILMLVAMFHLMKQETTNGPKWLWVILILFVMPLGAIGYFLFGRKHN
ncbi:PLD nuclease N-terminal domain-containing protein [Bacillus sp. JCM 19034]|uniref:PLD nuclease N-terminal domain-containing protein n=1 Tax=Bacillus sp. JCM 19034 TaxID=1481928 RepID=UPI000783EF0A|nr:PLD nuclease N-terminal domain-containing protein [Bacillus sp. JCM 19034]